MTVYLDLWSGRRILRVAKWLSCEGVWTDSWHAGEFLPGQNQKIPLKFYKFTHPFHFDNNPAASKTVPIHKINTAFRIASEWRGN